MHFGFVLDCICNFPLSLSLPGFAKYRRGEERIRVLKEFSREIKAMSCVTL